MMRYSLPLLFAALLSGCGSDSPSTSTNATAAATYDGDSMSVAPAGVGCSWPLVTNPDVLNVFFPDKAATYWIAAIPALPGTRLRVDGQYPDARYFSFTAYSPLLEASDGLADYMTLPVTAGSSPFMTAGVGPGAPYVAYVLPQPMPEQKAVNTLYAGTFNLTPSKSLPIDPLIILAYRIYLPKGSDSGSVPLPKLTLEAADTGVGLMTLDMSICQPLPPSALPSIVNPLIATTSVPVPLANAMSTQPLPVSSSTPSFSKYYTTAETVRVSLSAALGFDIPLQAVTMQIGLSPLPNPDNSYLSALMTRDKGSMYVVRGKAPHAAHQPSEAPLGSADLRYWSLCTNEIMTQRFVDCLVDADIPVDDEGYFTVVVSDPAGRPDSASADNGFGWLPWGGIYPDSEMIYRHMLPAPGFTQAIQGVAYDQDPAEVMGEYYPRIAYCDRATFEAAGSKPANVFRACQAGQER